MVQVFSLLTKFLFVALLCAVCGCTTVVKKTIEATGAVAETSLKATGAIAETSLKVGGKVAKAAVTTTIDVAAAAFKKGVVTVVDSATETSRTIPWEEGLQLSKLQATGRTVQILRGKKKFKGTKDTILHSGDVVRLQ